MRADAVELLTAAGAATLAEVVGRPCWCDPALRPVWPGARTVGRALPVATGPRDNLAIHRALVKAAAGDVLVVDGHGELAGYWGEIMTIAAMEGGVRGLVIDGGVRDTEPIARLGFPVFARGICVAGTAKADAGTVGEPVEVGGLRVERGDVVVADADGIVAFGVDELDGVLSRARERLEKERAVAARIRAGEATVGIYSLAVGERVARPDVGTAASDRQEA